MTFTLKITGTNTDHIKRMINKDQIKEEVKTAEFLSALLVSNPGIEGNYDTVAAAFKVVTDIVDNNPWLLEKNVRLALISVTDDMYIDRPILRIGLDGNGYIYLSKASEYKEDIEQISYERLHPVDNLPLLYGCWSINA